MKRLLLAGSLITAGLFMGGCMDDDKKMDTNVMMDVTYKVSVTNLTYKQPMSPVAVLLHTKDYTLYTIGDEASLGLEKLSEGGDNSTLLATMDDNIKAAKGGAGLILPGASESIEIMGVAADCISLASMLVNTNDAFVGTSCVDVSSLISGDKISMNLHTYDAGTEVNSESNTTVPGPAGGGEGFNMERENSDFVRIHAGVVTADDGLATSTLSTEHRWDNPTAMLTVERIN